MISVPSALSGRQNGISAAVIKLRRRRLVSQAKMAHGAIRRNAVRPRQHADRQFGDAGAVRADIGALVEKELVIQGQDAPFGIYCHAGMVALLARVVRGHQMLTPVLYPFDRSSEPHGRETDEKILGIEFAADSKPAAGIALLQYYR